jgi:hypothetical protein
MARTQPARADEPAWITAYFAAIAACDREIARIADSQPIEPDVSYPSSSLSGVGDLPYSAQF